MLNARHDLPLIDQIGITPERRCTPRILIYAQIMMWSRVGQHFHLHPRRPAAAAYTLAAIDAGDAVIGHQFTPCAIGKNHQLCNDFIQRRAAFARHYRDHIVFDIEVEIHAIVLLWL